jgi:hypothetical protein
MGSSCCQRRHATSGFAWHLLMLFATSESSLSQRAPGVLEAVL